MLDQLLDILRSSGLYAWEVSDEKTEGWEFYFIRHALDQNRAKAVEHITVKVYQRIGEEEIGAASAELPPTATAAEAKKLWKQLDPKLTDNEVYWKIDRIDYQKATGADSVSGYSYRLKNAIESNKAEEIRKVIASLLQHGRTQKQIKDALSDWKSTYLAADATGRIRIRDAITKAYKALGLTAADADKTINGWMKEKKTK